MAAFSFQLLSHFRDSLFTIAFLNSEDCLVKKEQEKEAMQSECFTQEFYPTSVYLGLSYACNMHCRHCYAQEKDRSSSLSKKEVFTLIDDLEGLFCCSIIFGHGEPFLYPHFLEVLKHTKKNGINPVVMTNGSLVTEEIAEILATEEVKPYKIFVSLDNCVERAHDTNRGLEGAYRKAIRTIKLLKLKGLDVNVASVIDMSNLPDLSAFITLSRTLQLSELSLLTIRDGKAYTQEQIESYLDFLSSAYTKMTEDPEFKLLIHDPLIIKYGKSRMLSRDLIDSIVLENRCTAGIERISILPDGNVTPCNLISDIVLGNIREQRISEIWNGSEILKNLRNRKACRPATCQDCSEFPVCQGGCLAYGNYKDGKIDVDRRCRYIY